mgnify:CR=1 FL=1
MINIKVGIFTDTYLPNVNGVVSSIKTLKNGLENLGHKVYIITLTNNNYSKNKSDMIEIPGISLPSIPEHKIGMFYSYGLINKIKKLDLDIIHTQTEFSAGLFGRFIAKLYDIPVVHTYHTMYEDYVHHITGGKMEGLASNLAKKMSKLYCKNCDELIVPTEKTKNALQSYGLKRDIKIIPTGINLKKFNENIDNKILDNLKNKMGIRKNDSILLYIGRLAKEKSIDVIIKNMPPIINNNSNVKLLIIGDGPEKNRLKEISQKLNITNNVIFVGEKPWNKIQNYYKIADVFVNASVTETQGLTYIEAMASSLPVVASYDKNLECVIDDQINGFFFKSKSDFIQIINQLLEDEILRKKIKGKAVIKANKYSAEKFAQNIERLYFNILKENGYLMSITG